MRRRHATHALVADLPGISATFTRDGTKVAYIRIDDTDALRNASHALEAAALTAPNRNQVNVNSVLLSLILAGDPNAGLAKGVEVNDKDYLPRFPFLAPAHQGLLQGHGGTNTPTVPNIPIP